MMQSYLATGRGLLQEHIFPLETRVTIGRDPKSDIHLDDLSVSRRHAVVYMREDEPILEDLGSKNGTFVNGAKVKRALLTNGDSIQVGNVTCRFLQEEKSQEPLTLTDTQEISAPVNDVDLEQKALLRRSSRLSEALSKVPLFGSLDKETLAQLSQESRLRTFDRGSIIVRQGGRARCLSVVVDGRVRMFTYDQRGREITLSFLIENQFFGESAFLTGAPRPSMIQAVEDTLICEVGFDAMQALVQSSPAIKSLLERYYRRRLSQVSAKQRAVGFMERRRHPRFNDRLDVKFSVSPSSEAVEAFQGKTYGCETMDISLSGMGVRVGDLSAGDLPAGTQLRLEIFLPGLAEPIRCLGSLRSVIEGDEGQKCVQLGIEFFELTESVSQALQSFLYN